MPAVLILSKAYTASSFAKPVLLLHSKMEIVSVAELSKQRNGVFNLPEGQLQVIPNLEIPSENKVYQQNPFMEANTKSVSLSTLKNDCIIPVFSKDNEKTLAHQEFIEIAQEKWFTDI